MKMPQMYGRSLVPLMNGKTREHWEYVFTTCYSWTGEGRINYLPSLITVTSPQWSLLVGPEPTQPELYDLRVDTRQQHNCINQYPDIAKQLHKSLVEFMQEQSADEGYIEEYARL